MYQLDLAGTELEDSSADGGLGRAQASRSTDPLLTQQGITDMFQLFVILQPHLRREIMARARPFAEGRMGGDDFVVLGIGDLGDGREVDVRDSGKGVGR